MKTIEIIAWIFTGVGICSVILALFGCGSVPFDACSQSDASEKRCSEDGTEVQLCAGGYWNPIVQCDEISGPDGNPVESKCVENECWVVTK